MPHGLTVSGHVVRARLKPFVPFTSVRHRNSLAEKAWEDAAYKSWFFLEQRLVICRTLQRLQKKRKLTYCTANEGCMDGSCDPWGEISFSCSFPLGYISVITQWRIQGKGPGSLPPPLFLDQAKNVFGDRTLPPPYLRVWMTGAPPYLKVWIRHCH